jgi:hypothetical protein
VPQSRLGLLLGLQAERVDPTHGHDVFPKPGADRLAARRRVLHDELAKPAVHPRVLAEGVRHRGLAAHRVPEQLHVLQLVRPQETGDIGGHGGVGMRGRGGGAPVVPEVDGVHRPVEGAGEVQFRFEPLQTDRPSAFAQRLERRQRHIQEAMNDHQRAGRRVTRGGWVKVIRKLDRLYASRSSGRVVSLFESHERRGPGQTKD